MSQDDLKKRLTDEHKALIRSGRFGIYVRGLIAYTDVFGESHETRFRYVYGGGSDIHPQGHLAVCEDGNEST